MKKLLIISSLLLAVSGCGPEKKHSAPEKNQENRQAKKDSTPDEKIKPSTEGENQEKETPRKKKPEAEKKEKPATETEVGDEEANALYTANSIAFKSELQLPLGGKINAGGMDPYLVFVDGAIAQKPLYEEKRSHCTVGIDITSPRGEDSEIYSRTKQLQDYVLPAFKTSMIYESFFSDWTYADDGKPLKRIVSSVTIRINPNVPKDEQGIKLRRRDGKPTTAKIWGFSCRGDSLTKESIAKTMGIPIEFETLPGVE